MYLDPRGIGSTLIFPYYTVNAGQSTLITIVNTSAKGKILNINTRQGSDSYPVGESSTIYLAARDTWTATVFATSDTGVANVITGDTTCALLRFSGDYSLPDGRHYGSLQPHAANVANPTADEILGTREGFVEVIEVGELDASDSTLAAQRDCQALKNIYPGGNYRPRLLPPAGGLYGSAAIVNAAQGTYFAEPTVAIADFSDIVNGFPDGGIVPFARLDQSNRYALVSTGNHLSTFDGGAQLPEAKPLSALLMSDAIWADFVREAGSGASTEWVVTRPTAYTYYGTTPQPDCLPFAAQAQDREGNLAVVNVGSSPPAPFSLCHAVDVIDFGLQRATSPQLGSRLSIGIGDPLGTMSSGSLELIPGATTIGGAQPTLASASGNLILRGAPVIGFQVVNYVNANVTPGVLSNYAAAAPLHTTVGCATASGAAAPCP